MTADIRTFIHTYCIYHKTLLFPSRFRFHFRRSDKCTAGWRHAAAKTKHHSRTETIKIRCANDLAVN
jgi:hypothetical protein